MANGYEIKAQANTAKIDLIGDINWWQNDSESFTRQVDELLAAGVINADLYINSGGGSLFDANEIANQIKRFPGSKTGKIGALCASAATVVSGELDTVELSLNSIVMVHEPRISTSGTSKELESKIQLLTQLTDQLVQSYIAKAAKRGVNYTEEEMRTMLAAETWMNAATAKAKGFADSISGVTASADKVVTASLKSHGYKNMPQALCEVEPPKQQTKSIIKMKKILILLASAGYTLSENASEVEIENTVERLVSDNTKLRKDLDDTKKSVDKAKAKMLIDTLVENKQIAESERASWEKDAEENYELTAKMAARLPKPTKATSAIKEEPTNNGGGNTEDRKDWTLAMWKEKDPTALAKMVQEKSEVFASMYLKEHGRRPW